MLRQVIIYFPLQVKEYIIRVIIELTKYHVASDLIVFFIFWLLEYVTVKLYLLL